MDTCMKVRRECPKMDTGLEIQISQETKRKRLILHNNVLGKTTLYRTPEGMVIVYSSINPSLLSLMELSYGVSFGKKSKTVTRGGDIVEELEVAENEHPRISRDTDTEFCQFPGYVVGHANRNYLTEEVEHLDNTTPKVTSRKRLLGSNYFDNLYSKLSCEDLPHPSKLRKHRPVKRSKIDRKLEKQMCVDQHLHQLRQRNNKYRQYKKDVTTASPNPKDELQLLFEPRYPTKSYCNSDMPQSAWDQTSSSEKSDLSVQSPTEYLPTVDISHFKEQTKSKQLMFPPGSVLLGSATLEQEEEEEEKWFQELWKPRTKSRCTEE